MAFNKFTSSTKLDIQVVSPSVPPTNGHANIDRIGFTATITAKSAPYRPNRGFGVLAPESEVSGFAVVHSGSRLSDARDLMAPASRLSSSHPIVRDGRGNLNRRQLSGAGQLMASDRVFHVHVRRTSERR